MGGLRSRPTPLGGEKWLFLGSTPRGDPGGPPIPVATGAIGGPLVSPRAKNALFLANRSCNKQDWPPEQGGVLPTFTYPPLSKSEGHPPVPEVNPACYGSDWPKTSRFIEGGTQQTAFFRPPGRSGRPPSPLAGGVPFALAPPILVVMGGNGGSPLDPGPPRVGGTPVSSYNTRDWGSWAARTGGVPPLPPGWEGYPPGSAPGAPGLAPPRVFREPPQGPGNQADPLPPRFGGPWAFRNPESVCYGRKWGVPPGSGPSLGSGG